MKANKLMYITIFLLSYSIQSLAYEPNEGQLAPDFKIMQLDGKPFELSQYKGNKSVYVIFWNTWCHYCMKKVPKLLNVQKQLHSDIKIIAINTSRDDSVAEIEAFKKRFNIDYSIAFDEGKKITDLYNVHGVPTEFIIDINGIIKHRDGVPDKIDEHISQWNTLKNSLAQIINFSKQQFKFWQTTLS